MYTHCRLVALLAAGLTVLGWAPAAQAFCGFYVGKADARLFNQASQVAMVRDGERTVLTMSNDYQGELTDFALVVPVPTVLEREQIHVGERRFLERLDGYSAPRLVEYFDEDPCAPQVVYESELAVPTSAAADRGAVSAERTRSLGVKVEAQYTVGEYDILILSARESSGLETWLRESGYKIPAQASRALQPYIKQDMKFFVAKVNLEKQAAGGYTYLRPLQIAYESKKFMLPIRLGMANARGAQDLVIYALTRQGRVESSNYRTVKVPSDVEVPLFVKDEFGRFYQSVFERAHEKEGRRAILTEYVWDMGWCDPCAADPLTPEELKELGVFWLEGEDEEEVQPRQRRRRSQPSWGGASPVVLTRMHVRYDAEHFPEDLVFQVTEDRQNFQGRYILRHPFRGDLSCQEGKAYKSELEKRHEAQAETLAGLTGWELASIHKKMGPDAPGKKKNQPWYKRLWK